MMAELKAKVVTLETANKALLQHLTCDVSKCTAVVYKKCSESPLCGTGKDGVSCAYLPDGIGQTGCGEEACTAVNGTTETEKRNVFLCFFLTDVLCRRI